MSTNGLHGPSDGPGTVETKSAELADLATELNTLTDLMEVEWDQRRTISPEHARRLSELRQTFERLIAE